MGRRPMCGTREGAAVWCNLDACGLVCAVITYSLVGYAQYTVTTGVLRPWMGSSFFGVAHTVTFNALAFLAHVSHARAMLTDPGAVSSNAVPPASEVEAGGGGANGTSLPADTARFCRKCCAYKPVRAHHCSICRRCVVKMDHHCPWVNNCVGIGNHKFFLQFISYVFAISVYALALVIGRFMACVRNPPGCDDSSNMLVVFLVVEAVLFGMFTMCMVCDQWETVSTNQTHIDRLKGEHHSQSPDIDINEVFGGARNGRRLALDFFLPTRVTFPADIWEEVMGYRCRDPCGLAAAAVAKVSGGGGGGGSGGRGGAREGLLGNGGGRGGGRGGGGEDEDEDEYDDDAGSGGDVELGEFYSGASSGSGGGFIRPGLSAGRGQLGGTMRERRQSAADTQRLLAREAAGNGGSGGIGGGAGGGSRSLVGSPHAGRELPGDGGPSSLLLPSAAAAISNVGGGGGGGGGGGFREDNGGRGLP